MIKQILLFSIFFFQGIILFAQVKPSELTVRDRKGNPFKITFDTTNFLSNEKGVILISNLNFVPKIIRIKYLNSSKEYLFPYKVKSSETELVIDEIKKGKFMLVNLNDLELIPQLVVTTPNKNNNKSEDEKNNEFLDMLAKYSGDKNLNANANNSIANNAKSKYSVVTDSIRSLTIDTLSGQLATYYLFNSDNTVDTISVLTPILESENIAQQQQILNDTSVVKTINDVAIAPPNTVVDTIADKTNVTNVVTNAVQKTDTVVSEKLNQAIAKTKNFSVTSTVTPTIKPDEFEKDTFPPCEPPISFNEFLALKKSAVYQPSEQEMYLVIVNGMKNKCFRVDQIANLSEFFTTDNLRLELFETAFPQLIEKNKALELRDLLQSATNKSNYEIFLLNQTPIY